MKSKYYYFEIYFEIQETATELWFSDISACISLEWKLWQTDIRCLYFLSFYGLIHTIFLHSLYQTRHLIYVYNISLYEPKLLNCVKFWSNEEKRYHRLFKTRPINIWQVVCSVFRRGFHSSSVVLVSQWLLFLHVIRDWGPEALIGARWGRLFQGSLFFCVKFLRTLPPTFLLWLT